VGGVAEPLVERDGALLRGQTHVRRAEGAGPLLEGLHDPSAAALSAPVHVDGDPLDLGDVGGHEAHAAGADRALALEQDDVVRHRVEGVALEGRGDALLLDEHPLAQLESGF